MATGTTVIRTATGNLCESWAADCSEKEKNRGRTISEAVTGKAQAADLKEARK